MGLVLTLDLGGIIILQNKGGKAIFSRALGFPLLS